jgi:putative NADH-flavin reductase
MNLAVFGSTGLTGRELVKQALDAGHHIAAFARSPAKLDIKNERLTVVQGELDNIAAIERTVRGADAVISILGPTGEVKGAPLSTGTKNILAAMDKFGVRRIILVGTASVSDPLDLPDFKFKLLIAVIRTLLPGAYAEIIRIADAARSTGHDWTIVRAPLLTNRPKTGKLRIGYYGQGRIGLFLSRADMAAFMLEQVTDARYIRKAPAISN